MANIKDLKKKIRATKQTYKITSAMKLVAASKFAKSQDAFTHTAPYIKELEITLKDIIALRDDYSHPFLVEEDRHDCYMIVITSCRGLCGGYNTNLIKKVMHFIETSTSYEFHVTTIGKKGREALEGKVDVGDDHTFEKTNVTYEEIHQLAEKLAQDFREGKFGRLFVAYNHYESMIKYEPTIKQLLPFSLSSHDKDEFLQEYGADFIYDLSPFELLDTLVPEIYYMSLYMCQLSAWAAEHSARMNAMESATENSAELIEKVTLKMNKVRQAAITTELIEVVSSAESLKG